MPEQACPWDLRCTEDPRNGGLCPCLRTLSRFHKIQHRNSVSASCVDLRVCSIVGRFLHDAVMPRRP